MDLKVEKNIPLSQYTTLKVGGVADYFVEVKSDKSLIQALNFAKQTSALPIILGGGSNVLVGDEGYRGLVIKNSIKGISYKEDTDNVILTAGAGEEWDGVVEDSVDKGYWGLENLSAIPGTVGATPVQNVGAYGVEVSSLIEELAAINIETLEIRRFSNKECGFGYRDSYFKSEEGRDWVITSVKFNLSKTPNPKLTYASLQELPASESSTSKKIRDKVIEIRSAKFPNLAEIGTAGSFFKNPIISSEKAEKLKEKFPDLPCYEAGKGKTKISLGWVLDNVCNLRGYCTNGVCLYENQALVLVNKSASSASAIDNFADYVAKQVEEKTGIKIEREVRKV